MRKPNSQRLNILITGGFGYIGNEVIKRLAKKHKVIVNDIDSESARRFYPIWNEDITYIQEDVCDLKCPSDVDLVIHLAAEVGYVLCDQNPSKAIRTNIDGTRNVASFRKPTLFFSTGSVYGKLDSDCTEESECNPQTVYAKTKLEGESIIRSTEHCIVRPATAFGLSYKTRDDLLIHTLARTAVQEGEILLYQPKAVRTVYHVQQIARFVRHCVEHWPSFVGETFNLGNRNGNISKEGIVSEVAKHCSFKLEINQEMSDPDQRNYQVDYSKLNKLWDSGSDHVSDYMRNIINHYSH